MALTENLSKKTILFTKSNGFFCLEESKLAKNSKVDVPWHTRHGVGRNNLRKSKILKLQNVKGAVWPSLTRLARHPTSKNLRDLVNHRAFKLIQVRLSFHKIVLYITFNLRLSFNKFLSQPRIYRIHNNRVHSRN